MPVLWAAILSKYDIIPDILSQCAILITHSRKCPRTTLDTVLSSSAPVFSGINLLYSLCKLGYSCWIYESGTDLGGVWHWNTYPGCRVDTLGFIYQLSIPEISETWSFTEKYLSAETTVTGAWYDVSAEGKRNWRIETCDGRVMRSQFFISCVGFAAEPFVPEFQGLETFKVEVCHSVFWPKAGIDVKGKKVAVIGTGASGVQIRTPNLALPMRQHTYSTAGLNALEEDARLIFMQREKTFSGYLDQPSPQATFDLYNRGGFAFLPKGYSYLLTNEKANREAYEFRAKRMRARITDLLRRDILAPLEPPHPIGAKRSCFETNVELVNVRDASHGISAIRPKGIETEDGGFYPVDASAFATNLDCFTGSLTRIAALRNTSGTSLADDVFLGMTRKGYFNMFLCYAVHGPTALSNGPALIEMQPQWIVDAIGANIPGRKREMLAFPGGLPLYEDLCRKALQNWDGFIIQ
ncbi:flavin-containing monooxygenase [Aspergillus brunneoviolaceus CBS 621.78]|uniref:FAD/NAD(P)-binding domain-containing protein n=1 Tax=Aspergillus brunneoviolaceus CBS 621.78 TaxID=1450534 RepID=A0ACD1G881_9EURO|nr:FAD/NAD(P)-binding domain-containing protein [Aspergillus brunneoviolaceus CBS 621.78]RAH45382.1 FAD/NAD(P)-binding domain-containing protein [Aspergillus brunneoviolaceus CBS 621.78]